MSAPTPAAQDEDQLKKDVFTRLDIYRQRIFGNNSGARNFIEFEEKRKMKWQMMIVYLFWLALAYIYTDKRLPIGPSFDVYQALESPIIHTPYSSYPSARKWDDIEVMNDVRSWLLNALPAIVNPEVQNFNKPLGHVRFTMRKMVLENSTNERFKAHYDKVWLDSVGIQPEEVQSSAFDVAPYGAYRKWVNVSLDWVPRDTQSSLTNRRCPSTSQMIDQQAFRGLSIEQVTEHCRQWCEQLIEPLTCHCFTVPMNGDGTCLFYQVPVESMHHPREAGPELDDLSNLDTFDDVLVPITEDSLGLRVNFPLSYQFQFTEATDTSAAGYIQHLDFHSQDELMAMAAATSTVPVTPARLMSNKIEDWIAGGYLHRTAVTFMIDFMTYNPNYSVYSRVRILFRVTASGHVERDYEINSLVITKSSLDDPWSLTSEFNSSLVDILYYLLVVVYICWEVWEMVTLCCSSAGWKYFYSFWNWMAVVHLLLHVITIIFWWSYSSHKVFEDELINMNQNGATSVSNDAQWLFDEQMRDLRLFKFFVSFNLLMTAMQLIRYLNDIFQRVSVLINTVQNSVVPIFCMFIILCDIFLGFMVFAHIMFGRSVNDYNTFTNAFVSVMALLVGEIHAFEGVKEQFESGSAYFYIPFMMLHIVFIVNFPRAVLNAAYQDASEDHEVNRGKEKSRQLAKDANTGSDFGGRFLKKMRNKLREMFPEDFDLVKAFREHEVTEVHHHKTQCALFLVFIVLYILLTYIRANTAAGGRLTETILDAVKKPTFSKTNEISGDLIPGSNFDSIYTREDVALFSADVLPYTLYDTSDGDFNGQPNSLKTYQSALPAVFDQLVINNWNIVVGQLPVRLTVKNSKMEPLGGRAVQGVLPDTTPVRKGRESDDDLPVTLSEESLLPSGTFEVQDVIANVGDAEARAVLQQYCNYSFGHGATSTADNNGFVCMLGVNRTTTEMMLGMIKNPGIITDETVALSFDFVVYNAFFRTFAHTLIWFGFQPNGIVSKDVVVESVRLELYTGAAGVMMLILEIVVLLMNLIYLIHLLFALGYAVRRDEVFQNAQGIKKFTALLRAVVLFFLLDWFNPLDLVSSILTIAMMAVWYTYVFTSLRLNYFFLERPVWIPGECVSNSFTWCSDQEVITEFALLAGVFRTFIRICAINTIFIMFRILKYLRGFATMRLIFAALARGIEDILWFVVILFVVLLGYMNWGHYYFGAETSQFRNMRAALLTLFELFLGTVDYERMAHVNVPVMLIYMITFWFVLKLIAINMFLAIIDKNYQDEEAEREEADGLANSASTLLAGVSAPVLQLLGRAARPMNLRSPQDILSAAAATVNEVQGAGIDMLGIADEGSPDVVHHESLGMPVIQEEVRKPIELENVQDENWQQLPEDMKKWAIERAQDLIAGFLDRILAKRPDEENDPLGLEKRQEEAETEITQRKKECEEQADEKWTKLKQEELSVLQKVHQDQESLSWYIMKREDELKKLESAKEVKQDRFDKMVKAAKSLISNEEDELEGSGGSAAGGLMQLTDR